jgi:O-antigen/teichoic acid export membrane protein
VGKIGLTKSKVFTNASWIIGCKVVQGIIGLIISMLTARYLGPSNFGLINYAASIAAFFLPIMQLGLSNVLVQEFINRPELEGKILGTSLVMSGLSGIGCLVGVFIFTFFVNASEPLTITVCVLYSLSIIAQAVELTQYWFQSKLKSKYVSLSSLVAYIIVAVYQIYLLASGKSVVWFAITYTIQYAMIAFMLLLIYKKQHGQPLSISRKMARSLFTNSKYYIISSMMVMIFAQTDRIMLKNMLNSTAVGYYSAAIACAGLTNFVFQAISDSFRPSIFEAKKTDQAKYELNISRLYCVMIYLSLAQCVVMTFFAPLIIHVLYGNTYDPAINALRIGVWYTTFSYLGVVRNIWILAENKQKYLWIINLAGALMNIVLNAILIPIIGIYGAAVASLITQFFTNVIIGYVIKPIKYNNKLMIKGLNPRLITDLFVH